MVFNLASHILINLLLPEFNVYIQKHFTASLFAVSPISEDHRMSEYCSHSIIVTTSLKKITFHIATRHFTHEEDALMQQYFKGSIGIIQTVFQAILKKSLSAVYCYQQDFSLECSSEKQITISIDEDSMKTVTLFLPTPFLRLFSKSIQDSTDTRSVEHEIITFFKNPLWLLPNSAILLSIVSPLELKKLINELQKSNNLTPYQLLLLITAFPEMSLKIKNALSKNTMAAIREIKQKMRKKTITHRDLAGGIYSVEESILFMMKNGHNFSYSFVLEKLQKTIQQAITHDLLLKKNFHQWFSEMDKSKLLYNTIAKCNDITIACAFYGFGNEYNNTLKKTISSKRLNDILLLMNTSISFDQHIEAQIQMIQHYRKIKLGRLNVRHESLEYLIAHFEGSNDFYNLLLSVGWYVLSTSLKGLNKKTISRVLTHLSSAPKFLIEDVLKGIINPNILHDEIQIHKAKEKCIRSIFDLYESGILMLFDTEDNQE